MHFTKKLIAVSAMSVALFGGLAACGDDDPTPTPTPTTAPGPTIPPVPGPNPQPVPPEPQPNPGSAEGQYLDVLHETFPGLANYSDEDLVTLGYAVCDAFAQGVIVDDILLSLYNDVGLAPEETGGLTAASVYFFCPEYQPIFDAWLDSV